MKRIVFALAALGLLSACGNVPKPPLTPTIKTTVYVAVQVDPQYLKPETCAPWPKMTDFIVNGTSDEERAYLLAAYKAYSCEFTTRMKIGSEEARIAADVEKQNKLTTDTNNGH